MQIKKIYLENFKNMKQSTLDVKDKTIGIYGPNGSGKTSIVEAIKLLKSYVHISDTKANDFAKKFFRANEERMKIAIDFENQLELIKYEVEFERLDGIIQVVLERVSLKLAPQKTFKEILRLDNASDIVQPQLRAKNQQTMAKIGYDKKAYIQFMQFNSFFSLLNSEENQQYSGFQIFTKIQKAFDNLVVSMLEDNAIAQLQLILPLHLHTDGIHGVIPLNLNGGYHSREHVEILKVVIQAVNDLFQAIFPERTLFIQEHDIRQDENGEKVAVTLYVHREGNKIPIQSESTGTIKLISLLSALLAYVKYQDFILVIDELDAHIYEYLLAVLLERLSIQAKGQLIFTAHNLGPLERLGKNSIVFANENPNGVSFEYLKNVKKTTNIRSKYLRAIAYSTEDNLEVSGMNESALKMIVGNL
ncbi:MAG: AAA family ATPase [Culicoidibacterales bacterium]